LEESIWFPKFIVNSIFEIKLQKNRNLHISHLSIREKFALPHIALDLSQNCLSDLVWMVLLYVEGTIIESLPKILYPFITIAYSIQMLRSLVGRNLLSLDNKKIWKFEQSSKVGTPKMALDLKAPSTICVHS